MTNIFAPFMGSMDQLSFIQRGVDSKKPDYVVPTLKNLGTVTIPVVREIIAPASLRNEDSTITDIEHNGVVRVRAVANKFKFGERARGLQLLRHFNAGGVCAQNKTEIAKGQTPGDVFDLNTILFGDSTDAESKVLPIKAAVTYSDAISVQEYADSVAKTFHNRSFEDGTLYDAENQKNSVNLFERHFVKPGTLLLQVLTFSGKTAPLEALDHLLLSMGLAGAYGGQTSIYGVNVRNHILGVYAGRLERDVNSPYVALEALKGAKFNTTDETINDLQEIYAQAYATSLDREATQQVQNDLIARLEDNDEAMRQSYLNGKAHIKTFFDAWFSGIGGASAKASKV